MIVITSNSEKVLPEPFFLRRCVYYHIPLLDTAVLEKVIALRVVDRSRLSAAIKNSTCAIRLT